MRILAVASVAGFVMTSAASAMSDVMQVAPSQLHPGIYRQVRPGTLQPLKIGNHITVTRRLPGSVSFAIEAVRALDLNTGSIGGIMLDTLPSTWVQNAPDRHCRLHFLATKAGFTVKQDYTYGDCGFGYGVTADGTYVHVSSTDHGQQRKRNGAKA